jgi:hypothetical protein
MKSRFRQFNLILKVDRNTLFLSVSMATKKFVVTTTCADGDLEVKHYLATSRGEVVRYLAERELNTLRIMQSVIDIVLESDFDPEDGKIEGDFPLSPKHIFDLSKLIKGDLGEFAHASDFSDEKFPSISEILKLLSASEIEALFEYYHTAGEGDQEGDPGKEWHSIHIQEYKEPVFLDISKKAAVGAA